MVPTDWLTLHHVCVIGNTGTGKSALCNFLCGKKDEDQLAFPVSAKIDSCTNKTTAQKERWLGSGGEFILVDTPGFGDSGGNDSNHIAEMVQELKTLQYMNAFLILFNSQNPRLDEGLKGMIKLFTQIFGSERFYDNVVLVFTRWDHSEKGERKRQRSGESRASREMEFNRYFREAFGIRRTLPAVFFDAYPDLLDETECKLNLDEVIKLRRYSEELPPFPLEDAEAVRSFLDQLRDQIDVEQERADAAQEDARINAELAQEQIEARERDRNEYQENIKTMKDTHEKQQNEMVAAMKKQEEVWQKQKEEYLRLQREYENRIKKAKKKSKWGISLGPLRLELPW